MIKYTILAFAVAATLITQAASAQDFWKYEFRLENNREKNIKYSSFLVVLHEEGKTFVPVGEKPSRGLDFFASSGFSYRFQDEIIHQRPEVVKFIANFGSSKIQFQTLQLESPEREKRVSLFATIEGTDTLIVAENISLYHLKGREIALPVRYFDLGTKANSLTTDMYGNLPKPEGVIVETTTLPGNQNISPFTMWNRGLFHSL